MNKRNQNEEQRQQGQHRHQHHHQQQQTSPTSATYITRFGAHRAPIEPDAACVYIEAVQDLGQGLVQPQHDLNLPVGKL